MKEVFVLKKGGRKIDFIVDHTNIKSLKYHDSVFMVASELLHGSTASLSEERGGFEDWTATLRVWLYMARKLLTANSLATIIAKIIFCGDFLYGHLCAWGRIQAHTEL